MGSSASNQSPYVITWNTEAQPNQAELELVAVGKDSSGMKASLLPFLSKPRIKDLTCSF